ncbi:zinc finger BED domain-containing protein RICESLEEPER 1-like [Primulina tabacum]|uniref:zinc finger BED domain-containing protein RICESLEEPER 1-like n=1 Tax=Primulina tabacum TaxID=48773 RepID=UPI003F597BDA
MLDSAIKYKKAFVFLQFNDKNYKFCPSSEEWKRGEKICEFLEPFYDTTNLISGSSYPTSNLYFMQVWKIEVLLKENLMHEDEVISDMCKRMLGKFEKYWTQYSMVLAFGVILDPRIKLSMLEVFYSKVESDFVKCLEKIELVKAKFYKLFDEYSKTDNASSSRPRSSFSTQIAPQSAREGKGKSKSIFYEMMAYESQTITNVEKSQIDLYLEEPKLEFAYHQDLNVLEYWKDKKHPYPTIAMMACDVLAIPITTVASESSFSIGARVLTKYRSCTLPEKIQALICTRNWLHGYVGNEDDTSVKTALSNQGSNADIDKGGEDEDGGEEFDMNDFMINEI